MVHSDESHNMGTEVEARMNSLVVPRAWADADAGKGRKTWSPRTGVGIWALFGSLKESRGPEGLGRSV